MEWKRKIKELIRQVGYMRLVLLFICGIFLISVSFPDEKKENPDYESKEELSAFSTDRDKNDIYAERMEERLASILQTIEGAGKVQVMITLASSSESVVNKDEVYEESMEKGDGEKETGNSVRKEETVLTDQEGNQIPYVIKTMEPIIEGVVVVMQGGDNAYVSGAVTEAVQALFQIEAHKIKVLKMEDGS